MSMAGRAELKCIGPSYPLADRKSACQRSVNWYMSQIEGLGEDKQVVLRSTPGLEVFATLAADIRGTYNADGRWFVVAGNTLYEMSGATPVSRGTVQGAGFVSMKHGESQLVVVTGPNGYVFRLSDNTFAEITAPGWLGSAWVDHIDGYFVFVEPETERFYLSEIDDASSLDALDFSSADVQPDDIVTHRVNKRGLYLMGARSIELWINAGEADFPFVRFNTTPIDVGVVGPRAACIAFDTLVWVGQTDRGAGYVYKMNGYQPQRISTQAVEEAFDGADLSACSMWTYHTHGAEFVAVNAPGMATTWVYNAATQQWHEQAELENGEWVPLRTDQVTYFDGEHYATAEAVLYRVGGRAIGAAPLVRSRTWPHLVSPSLEPVNYRGLELACTTGAGGTITLEISNDGGYTFGPPLPRSLGAVGRWMQRVRWMLLGSSRDRVFRLRCSDAVDLTIHAATVDA